MKRPILITGGAGFIGTNVADRFLRQGTPVVILDNLSRAGVEKNLHWLRQQHGDRVRPILGDVRDRTAVARSVEGVSAVFHFAAQVAVTTSLVNPQEDFAINAGGTLNVLEALRAQENPPPLLFTSTNKVYGGLEDVALTQTGSRYQPASRELRSTGVGINRPLDFHSPYGCSKGTADQYVLDYARSFGMKTCVFRMSCIYGPHQFGTEDQGWVAHFLIQALSGKSITLYGDGKQVRDILFVEDLVDAFQAALANIDQVSGRAFNVGGGVNNTVSLIELMDLIHELTGVRMPVTIEGWRTGDQRYYVSDTRAIESALGWRPKVDVRQGITRLSQWLIALPPGSGRESSREAEQAPALMEEAAQ